MIEYKTIQETKEIKLVENVVCDKCQKKFKFDDLEVQEFFRIQKSCGYGSVFGDGSEIEMEMCQYCAKELFGQYLRISDE